MVSRKTSQRKTVRRRNGLLPFWGASIFLAAFVVTMIFAVSTVKYIERANEVDAPVSNSDMSECVDDAGECDEDEDVDAEKPEAIDLQPVVDAWVASTAGKKGVVIYDLDLDSIAGSYNANTEFATASLYKLFVVYEGYRLLESGAWNADATVGYTKHTVLECLDLAIRESNSSCAETLWAMMGRDNLDAAVNEDLGIDLAVGNLSATPMDIMRMMKIYYEHSGVTDEILVARMQDSFLNQPVTTYDWRQGLPSGFSDAVKVYNKVGWNYDRDLGKWTIYDDAAILDFTELGRHFIVVVMTSGVFPASIRNFAGQIEKAISKY